MLEVNGLSLSLKGRKILRDIHFTLRPGELVSLLGVNGSGKSTLIRAMTGLLKPEHGEVLVAGLALTGMHGAERARQIGYLPQKANGISCSVFDAVLLGRTPSLGWRISARDFAAVERVLVLLGLEHLAMRSTKELSGGEFQKVAIARALAQEPRILFLDEPINHLDIKNQMEIMSLLKKITRELDLVTVSVLHDLGTALRFSDRFLLLKEGGLYAWGDRSVVTAPAIREVFGMEALLHEVAGIPVVLPTFPCCRA
ncbi:MAG: ABC transporter ATP-binding protein [Proteobacteria bacterium]|mgnify:CR=1 FL=1|nr:ABC transporter ATP-binding protein [Pseudomonadota bacterium]MBU1545573.1 ABC transporter ATP-binding protein [Pseudomonadota bacterium]